MYVWYSRFKFFFLLITWFTLMAIMSLSTFFQHSNVQFSMFISHYEFRKRIFFRFQEKKQRFSKQKKRYLKHFDECFEVEKSENNQSNE